MLVADFVARSPADSARAGFIRHLADNVCQRVVVIVAAVPSAGHIAVIHRDAQTVHAVVVAVIALAFSILCFIYRSKIVGA